MLKKGKINFLLGMGFGSEGKGNVAHYIAKTHHIDMAISSNSPNAGHCFLDENGEKHILKMLPVSGVIAKNSTIILTSGSAIDIDRLMEEVNDYGVHDRLWISPNAPIVSNKCKEYEKENLQYISSTFQGSGAAFGFKAMRDKDLLLAKDVPCLIPFIKSDISSRIMNNLDAGQVALCEICQGYHLSVDSKWYPYCTSRPVNVGQSLAYLDLPPSVVGDVIGVQRSYNIRVGNVPTGYSGDVQLDSREITWDELSDHIGRKVLEMTTVTKRVRRLFTFSKSGFRMCAKRNGVNVVFLSFADYLLPDEEVKMIYYLNSFNFDEVYMVNGFGDFNKNMEKAWPINNGESEAFEADHYSD